MTVPLHTPFDTVEDAHEYVRLLGEAIAEAKSEVEATSLEPRRPSPNAGYRRCNSWNSS